MSDGLMPAGGQGACVSACADLTNQLQCCWVDPAACAWIKHWHSNCSLPVDGGGGTPRPILLTGAKKSGVPDYLRATIWAFRILLSVIKLTLKKKDIQNFDTFCSWAILECWKCVTHEVIDIIRMCCILFLTIFNLHNWIVHKNFRFKTIFK